MLFLIPFFYGGGPHQNFLLLKSSPLARLSEQLDEITKDKMELSYTIGIMRQGFVSLEFIFGLLFYLRKIIPPELTRKHKMPESRKSIKRFFGCAPHFASFASRIEFSAEQLYLINHRRCFDAYPIFS